MSNTVDDHPSEGLRRLTAGEVLGVFVVGRVVGRVRLSPEHPRVGELLYDTAGRSRILLATASFVFGQDWLEQS